MLIKIKNLRLKTIIGTNDWERKKKQEVIINVEVEVYDKGLIKHDDIGSTLDYKVLNKKIISFVESSKFHLLERLTSEIIQIIIKDKRVKMAKVEVDKPGSIRKAESVSVECKVKKT